MFDELFPEARKAALDAMLQQGQADRKMCDSLPARDRANSKTCILIDDPADGWKTVQRMERQEAFLGALPYIVSAVAAGAIGLIAVRWMWRRYGTTACTALQSHFNSQVRLLQWGLFFVAVIAATAVIGVIHP